MSTSTTSNWYVIQVEPGREEAMVELIGRVASAPALEECFYPRYATQMKLHGSWQDVSKPLFPGYVMAVTDDVCALVGALARVPEFCRVLTMGSVPQPLGADEVALVGGLTHPGARTVPMSRGVKVGETVVVVEGPLVGREAQICSLNRHKRTATLELDLCGRRVSTRVGLEVVGAPDDPAARAALLQRRARTAATDGGTMVTGTSVTRSLRDKGDCHQRPATPEPAMALA